MKSFKPIEEMHEIERLMQKSTKKYMKKDRWWKTIEEIS